MLLLEHNGKALLRSFGISTPAGRLASNETELARVLDGLTFPAVLKAQVPAGGRGKAGGIAFAEDPEQARAALTALKGMSIGGHAVDSVLIEERVVCARESYAGIWIDGGEIRLLFARHGGIDIEDLAAADATGFQAIPAHPVHGPDSGRMRECFDRLGYASIHRAAYEDIGRKLFAMSRASDAIMIEINPLAELASGALMALDARVVIDDAALTRQPSIAAMQPAPAGAGGLPGSLAGPRVKTNPLGGSIGLVGLGGGLNVTLMDWIASAGSGVGALVDIDEAIGSGRAEEGFRAALEAFDCDPAIKSILVNVITCGYRLDDIVAALLSALSARPAARAKPTILHLRGNGMARTPAMLEAAGRRNSPSLAAAIEAVVAAGT